MTERHAKPGTLEETLADIADFARSAARIVARGVVAYFDPEDDTPRRAGTSLVIDLSAAADRLPESFRSQHPDVPWREIRATRNFAAHDYRGVNDRITWEVLRTEFPRLTAQLDLTDA